MLIKTLFTSISQNNYSQQAIFFAILTMPSETSLQKSENGVDS